MKKPPYAERIKRAKRKMAGAGLGSFLVNRIVNIRYLCGFSGSRALLLFTPGEVSLLVDGRYWQQAEAETSAVKVVKCGSELLPKLGELAGDVGISKLGFESEHTSCGAGRRLEKLLAGIELAPAEGIIEALRERKDPGEISSIRRAASLADRAYRHLLGFIKIGRRELELRGELVRSLLGGGSEGEAFSAIVASGPRSVLPHGMATRRSIKRGDVVVLDFGGVYDGYHSDLTRTLKIGRMTDCQRRAYAALRQAQKAAIASIRAGGLARMVDGRARAVIEDAGFGKYFTHGLGHGVGLEVHEAPALSEKSTAILRAGMVVTVEPGIYIPGEFGMRLEDLVLVKENGAEVLSRAPRNFREL